MPTYNIGSCECCGEAGTGSGTGTFAPPCNCEDFRDNTAYAYWRGDLGAIGLITDNPMQLAWIPGLGSSGTWISKCYDDGTYSYILSVFCTDPLSPSPLVTSDGANPVEISCDTCFIAVFEEVPFTKNGPPYASPGDPCTGVSPIIDGDIQITLKVCTGFPGTGTGGAPLVHWWCIETFICDEDTCSSGGCISQGLQCVSEDPDITMVHCDDQGDGTWLDYEIISGPHSQSDCDSICV